LKRSEVKEFQPKPPGPSPKKKATKTKKKIKSVILRQNLQSDAGQQVAYWFEVEHLNVFFLREHIVIRRTAYGSIEHREQKSC
jgi:hypothetical protein